MRTSSKQNSLSNAAVGSALAPIKFGLGGVPLGNEFEVVSDEDAHNTLEAAGRLSSKQAASQRWPRSWFYMVADHASGIPSSPDTAVDLFNDFGPASQKLTQP
jgi:hypothetical protein